MRLRRLVAGMAFALGLSASAHATIPLFSGPQDPSQLFVYLNTLVNEINTGVVLTNGVSFGVSQAVNSNLPIVNGIQVTGGSAGVPPSIGTTGSDANVDLLFQLQGNGLIRFDLEQFVPQATLIACPGFNGRINGSNSTGFLSPNPTINGYQ